MSDGAQTKSRDKEPAAQCFFRVSIGGEILAKDIVVELDIQNYPRTCESFLSLCVQNARKNKDSSSNDPPLRTNRTSPQPTYRGCEFHRVVPGLCVQAGDWERFDGTGGFSPLYGRNWKDEEGGDKKYNKHDREGIVSMANAGKPNTNGSQFFVTLKPTPHLDRKHTAFGRIVSGMESVRKMSDVERGEKDRPVSLQRIVIEDCGPVSLGKRLDASKTGTKKEESIRRSRSKEDKRKKSRKRERKKREKKRRRHHRDDSSTGGSSYSSNDSDDDSGSRTRKGHRRERHSRKHRKRKRRRRTNDKYHASSDDDDESSNSSASSISRDQKHQKRRSSRDESSRRDSRKKRSREKKGRNVEKRTTR